MTDNEPPHTPPVCIALVGASAGGLQPLRALIGQLPADGRFAVIVAQHLAPDAEGKLDKILGQATSWPVSFASDGQTILPGHVYICPPSRHTEVLGVQHPRLRVREPSAGREHPAPSIDKLFESTAHAVGPGAIGVILSGSGRDGTIGAQVLDALGGVVLVQAPDEAQFPSMPMSALGSGVTTAWPTDQLGMALLEACTRATTCQTDDLNDERGANLDRLLGALLAETGMDFRPYRTNGLIRRIRRRMQTLGYENLEPYLAYAQRAPEELQVLHDQLLLPVTAFLRDGAPFDLLQAYLRERLESKPTDEPLRIWVAGCATGEEAYSLAMLASELLAEGHDVRPLQIFATDLQPQAIATARAGIYDADALDALPKAWRVRYLTRQTGGQFAVSNALREKVVFSIHNLLEDPPFLRMDLVSCRNLLIYLRPSAQKKVLRTFHHILAENGLLLLGKSETLGELADGFTTLNEKWRLFRKHYMSKSIAHPTPSPSIYRPPLSRPAEAPLEEPRKPLPAQFEQAMAELSYGHYVVTSPSGEMVYTHGQLPLLRIPQGMVSQRLTDFLDDSIDIEIKTLIQDALIRRDVVRSPLMPVKEADIDYVRVSLKPLFDGHELSFVAIAFEYFREKDLPPLRRQVTDAQADLRDELERTRNRLKSVIIELEESNQAATALNEELQAANEELESSNEELQTANEELQSSNEEVEIAYAELKGLYNSHEQHRREVEMALHRYEDLYERLGDGFITFDMSGHVQRANQAFLNLVGYRLDELRALPIQALTKGDAVLGPDSKAIMAQVHASDSSDIYQTLLLGKTGGIVPVELRLGLLRDTTGEPEGSFAIVRDIRDRKAAEDALLALTERIQLATEGSGVGIWDWDVKAAKLTWDAQMFKLYDVDPATFSGSFEDWKRCVHPEDVERAEAEFLLAMDSGKFDAEFRIQWRDDSVHYMKSHATFQLDHENLPVRVIGTNWDITTERLAEQALLEQAQRDALTGLPNRVLVMDRLNQAIKHAQRHDLKVACLFLDLDRFKDVNDAWGHPVGDQLLIDVAKRLRAVIRREDTLGRLGGDEFVILLAENNPTQITLVCQHLLEALRAPFALGDKQAFISGSIGVALYPDDGKDADTLIKNADTAMYRAKADGRDDLAFYTREMTENAFARLEIHAGLREALKEGQFEVYYQPLFAVDTMESCGAFAIVGLEALVRWNHPQLGIVPPARFIAAAEESRLIHALDSYVLCQALEQVRAWREQGLFKGRVAANISLKSIDALELPPCVSDDDLQHLTIEITESQIMRNPSQFAESLLALRRRGARIAVDDFGTGYSSLSYLKTLPIDIIKIDRSFVKDIERDDNDKAIIRTVLAMAKELGMKVVAEGIETEAQLRFLHDQACPYGQGYLCSPPLRAEEIEQLLGRPRTT